MFGAAPVTQLVKRFLEAILFNHLLQIAMAACFGEGRTS